MNSNTIKLCCGGNGCPTITRIDDEKVEITDDSGNKVVMKSGEAKLIADAVKKLDGKSDELLLG